MLADSHPFSVSLLSYVIIAYGQPSDAQTYSSLPIGTVSPASCRQWNACDHRDLGRVSRWRKSCWAKPLRRQTYEGASPKDDRALQCPRSRILVWHGRRNFTGSMGGLDLVVSNFTLSHSLRAAHSGTNRVPVRPAGQGPGEHPGSAGEGDPHDGIRLFLDRTVSDPYGISSKVDAGYGCTVLTVIALRTAGAFQWNRIIKGNIRSRGLISAVQLFASYGRRMRLDADCKRFPGTVPENVLTGKTIPEFFMFFTFFRCVDAAPESSCIPPSGMGPCAGNGNCRSLWAVFEKYSKNQ